MADKVPIWDSADFEAAPACDLSMGDEPPAGGTASKFVYVRVAPSAHRTVKALASEQGLSLEQLGRRALNDYLIRHGRDPVA